MNVGQPELLCENKVLISDQIWNWRIELEKIGLDYIDPGKGFEVE